VTVTAQTVLAAIEAIPETPENYRAWREARDAAKKLTQSGPRVIGYAVVGRDDNLVKGYGPAALAAAQEFAVESTRDCADMGIDWEYRVTEITEARA